MVAQPSVSKVDVLTIIHVKRKFSIGDLTSLVLIDIAHLIRRIEVTEIITYIICCLKRVVIETLLILPCIDRDMRFCMSKSRLMKVNVIEVQPWFDEGLQKSYILLIN